VDICSFAWVEGEWSWFGAGLLLGGEGMGIGRWISLVSYSESFNPSIAPPTPFHTSGARARHD